MVTHQRNLDARIRQLAVIEVRLAKVSTSVANMGGIVRRAFELAILKVTLAAFFVSFHGSLSGA